MLRSALAVGVGVMLIIGSPSVAMASNEGGTHVRCNAKDGVSDSCALIWVEDTELAGRLCWKVLTGRAGQRWTEPSTQVTVAPPTQTVPSSSRLTCTRPDRPIAVPWLAT